MLVAPRAGARIETYETRGGGADKMVKRIVAPRAGARIETRFRNPPSLTLWSLPVRGRGLKLVRHLIIAGFAGRSPCGGAD